MMKDNEKEQPVPYAAAQEMVAVPGPDLESLFRRHASKPSAIASPPIP